MTIENNSNQFVATETQESSQDGDILKSNGLTISETVTTPQKSWKKPRPVWVVSGNWQGFEGLLYDLGGKKYRGSWSFFSNPTDELIEALKSTQRLSFAEIQEAKIDRKIERIEKLEGYAANAEKRSNLAYEAASRIGSFIPMGQPILVGHHSEKRHRRDISRIDNQMRKSVEESKKVDYFESKISTLKYEVGRNQKSRSYLGNRLAEAQSHLAKIQRAKDRYEEFHRLETYNLRLQSATEAVEYWSKSLKDLEAELLNQGGKVASPETIKPGYLIKYGNWYPVVRVNKKTVTISHWLDVPKFTFKLPYTKIQSFKAPEEKGAE